MLGRKNSDEPAETPEEQALEQRVDRMMSTEQPEPKPAGGAKEPASSAPPLDIFKDIKTAPLLQKLGVDDKPAAPSAKLDITPPPSTKQPASSAPAGTPAVSPKPVETDKLDDEVTDKAVDEIAAADSDTILEVEDATVRPPVKGVVGNGGGWKAKLSDLVHDKRAWAGLVALVIVVIFALPVTRYAILGLFVKEPVSLTLTDSTTNTPVSSAQVNLDGHQAKTDGEGKVSIKVPVGKRHLTITKQYYTDYSATILVGLKAQAVAIRLTATGRQVPITVVDKINGKPLADVNIKILNTTSKTDKNGRATIVLPANLTTAKYAISLSGYVTGEGSVTVTDKVVAANTLALLPTGHVFFLSNLSGKIDVVETNLDGSGRQIILAGTGLEDANSTTLLASRDWRFLLLDAQRSGSRPALYLIDTGNNNKLTTVDSNNTAFNLIGWDGHYFLYDSQSNGAPQSQAGAEIIKSYNADTGQASQLDQNQAQGTAASYAYQAFQNFYITSNGLLYTAQWYTFDTGGGSYDISSLSDTIRGIQPGGQNKKDYETFAATGIAYIRGVLYKPQAIYYQVFNSTTNNSTYYTFANGTVTTTANIPAANFNQTYPTYLLSPSSNLTFWTELRDGKNTLFTGDANAASPKQIATLSDYSPYGWYGDSYLLVSKNSSELYIMPVAGLATGQSPLKVSDYYKPNQTYNGYGYGYGGL